MKTLLFALVAALLFGSPSLRADCPGQSGSSADPGQSGSADPGQTGSSQDPGQSGSADPGQTGSAQYSDHERVSREERTGVVVRGGRAYLVTKEEIHPIDATLIPPGQMLTEDGNLLPAPANITALDATAVPDEGAIVLRGEVAYMIHNGATTPLNATTVPEGMILTFEGDLEKAPKRTAGLP